MFLRISLLLVFIAVACANPPPTPTPMLATVAPTLTATSLPTVTPTPTADPPTATPTPTATPIPPTATPTPTATPIPPTATPTPTATPRPTPTPVPQPTLRPQQLYQLDYAVGYGSWEKCGDTVSYQQAVAIGYGQGYAAGSLAAEAEFCPPAPTPTPTPTPTATPRPVQFITAPREVWDCFLARDDSVTDKYDVVLSPCGWTETVYGHVDFDLAESIRNSPVASSFIPKGWDRVLHVEYVGRDEQQRVQAELLEESLEELSELLRIDLDIMDAEAATDDSTLHVRFLYVETLECGERVERFWGCAECGIRRM